MANPNILNVTSVKYYSIQPILYTDLFTFSSSLSSDYQTKNIVLRNNLNSGKILKISRISISNEALTNTSGQNRDFEVTFIKDYTDSTVGDMTRYIGSITAIGTYATARVRIATKNIAVGGFGDIQSEQLLPSGNTTDLYYNTKFIYLMEGNAIEAIADDGGGGYSYPAVESYHGRARIHIDYEEYDV